MIFTKESEKSHLVGKQTMKLTIKSRMMCIVLPVFQRLVVTNRTPNNDRQMCLNIILLKIKPPVSPAEPVGPRCSFPVLRNEYWESPWEHRGPKCCTSCCCCVTGNTSFTSSSSSSPPHRHPESLLIGRLLLSYLFTRVVIELLIEYLPPPLCTHNYTNPFQGAQNSSTIQRNRRSNSELICVMNGEGPQEDFCHPKMCIVVLMPVHMWSHLLSTYIQIKRATTAQMRLNQWKPKYIMWFMPTSHSAPLSTPICHRAAVSMKRKTKGEHVVPREDKHTRLSGLHMHEFEGKQGFTFAESVRKRLHLLNSMVATAGVTVEVD